jgi:hypothetical protein
MVDLSNSARAAKRARKLDNREDHGNVDKINRHDCGSSSRSRLRLFIESTEYMSAQVGDTKQREKTYNTVSWRCSKCDISDSVEKAERCDDFRTMITSTRRWRSALIRRMSAHCNATKTRRTNIQD